MHKSVHVLVKGNVSLQLHDQTSVFLQDNVRYILMAHLAACTIITGKERHKPVSPAHVQKENNH